MSTVKITVVSPSDLEQLQKIAISTFKEAFSIGNSEKNMKTYLETKFSLKQLAAELSDGNSSFYFAKHEDQIVGYLKLNFGRSQTELKDENALEIERIYVLKEFHGKKVGQLLYDKAIEVAHEKKVNYMWLGVWENNPRAIAFYRKNGFIEFDKHIFQFGHEEQTDIMMKMTLTQAT
jgi:diamine N-acetyltransferase